VCAAAAVLGAGVALYEGFRIASGDEALAPSESSGWGLHLTLVASVSLLVASAVSLRRDTSAGASLASIGARQSWIPGASQRTGVWLQRTAIGLLVFVTIVWLGVHPMLGLMVWPLALSALLARRYPRAVGVFLVALGVVVTAGVTFLAITEPEEWDEVESQGLASEPAFWVALTLIPPIAGLLLLATRSRRTRSLSEAPDSSELQAHDRDLGSSG
jgi:type IV secretory pathway TrbD component